MITKRTKIYGSFSRTPGEFGCKFHNAGFRELQIDAIYKPFKVVDLRAAVQAMKVLGIAGVGVSMPFKIQALDLADTASADARGVGATNTLVLNDDGSVTAFNTDYVAAKAILQRDSVKKLVILGDGGYSKAVQYTCRLIGCWFELITRHNWDRIYSLRDITIFNCTPVELEPHPSCNYIDCLVSTSTGAELAEIQAREQFKLYTGKPYPDLSKDREKFSPTGFRHQYD